MKRIPNFILALYKNHQVNNPTAVKNAGLGVSIATALVSTVASVAVANGWVDSVPEEVIMGASSVLVTMMASFMAYVTAATSKKVGFRDYEDDAVEDY